MSLRSEIIRVMNELVIFGKKITGLPAGGTLTGAELFECVQGGTSVKISSQDIADLAAIGGGLPAGIITIVNSSYDLSGNVLPTTGGTGPGGVIKAGNAVRIAVEGSSFPTIPAGSLLIAGVDLPASLGDWIPVYTIV